MHCLSRWVEDYLPPSKAQLKECFATLCFIVFPEGVAKMHARPIARSDPEIPFKSLFSDGHFAIAAFQQTHFRFGDATVALTPDRGRPQTTLRDSSRCHVAVVGLAIPGKAPSAITITRCDCRSHSRTRTVPRVSSVRFWSKLASRGGHRRFGFLCHRPIQNLPDCLVEIAKAIGLEPIGDNGKQQMRRQMSGDLPKTLCQRDRSP
jgi:hypothetical protein